MTTLGKRTARGIIALIALLTAIAPSLATPARASTATPIYFGAYVHQNPGETGMAATQRVENLIGHKLGAQRVYMNWDDTFPNRYMTWLRQRGTKIFLSVKSTKNDGTVVPWRSIASASRGSGTYSRIVDWAKGIKSFGAQIYFIFNHEPEAKKSDPHGTSSDFIQAWRKIWSVFHNYGVNNVTYLWTMTDYAFHAPQTDDRYAPKWYPGGKSPSDPNEKYVDAIGADTYNWYNCRPDHKPVWDTLQQELAPVRDFAAFHHKTAFLPEFSSVEDPSTSGRKGNWVSQARTLFKQSGWGMFHGILWFNSQDGTYPACKWQVNTSSSALSAVKALAGDAYYSRSG